MEAVALARWPGNSYSSRFVVQAKGIATHNFSLMPMAKMTAWLFFLAFITLVPSFSSGRLACKNTRFSSLFAAGDVSRRGTSATQRQKFHTDDANQRLHNKCGSYGVPYIYICPVLCVFWSVLVKCFVHLPTSSSKTQILLLEKTIFHKYWLFCQRLFAFAFDLCGLLSFVCHS